MSYLNHVVFPSILILLSVICVNGQGSILFMNGKEETGKFIAADSTGVEFERHRRSKKKTKKYQLEKVFSITNKDGSKIYIYKPDSLETEILSIEEMELFVLGIREARIGYTAPLALWEGLFCGITAGFFGGPSPFYAPIPLAGNSIIVGNLKLKVNIESVLNPNYFKKDTFLAGYKEESGFKRMKNVTIGSLIGFSIGYAAYLAL